MRRDANHAREAIIAYDERRDDAKKEVRVRALVVDDEPGARRGLAALLGTKGSSNRTDAGTP